MPPPDVQRGATALEEIANYPLHSVLVVRQRAEGQGVPHGPKEQPSFLTLAAGQLRPRSRLSVAEPQLARSLAHVCPGGGCLEGRPLEPPRSEAQWR